MDGQPSYVHVSSNHLQSQPITIVDVVGKVVYEAILTQALDVDISSFAPGTYILLINEHPFKFEVLREMFGLIFDSGCKESTRPLSS